MRAALTKAFDALGVDRRQLTTLLGVYLKQDFRRQGGVLRFGKAEAVTGNKAVLFLIGVYVMMGLMIGMVDVTERLDVYTYSAVLLSFSMFVTGLAVIAESSNVIFNQWEVDIIGHLPLRDRTLFLAKALSLFTFALIITLSFNLFPSVLGVWAVRSNLLFCVAHPLSAVLVALFATALALVGYGAVMRLAGRERFDSIVTYSQIGLTLLFMFGYQIMPRVMGAAGLSLSSKIQWFHLLYPPAWYSGLTLMMLGHVTSRSAALAAISLAAVIVLAYVAVQKVGSGYSASLSRLAYGDSIPGVTRVKSQRQTSLPARASRFPRLTAVLLPSPVERAVFSLVSAYFIRNREVKVRVYPSLSYFIVFPLMGAFSGKLQGSMSMFWILMGAAMVPLVGLTAIEGLLFSEHYRAAHIFRIAPVANLGDIHSGVRKAVALCTVLPCFAIILIVFAVVFNSCLSALMLVIPWVLLTPTFLMFPFFRKQVLPLSRRYRKGEQSARTQIIALLSFFFLGGLVAVQTAAFRGSFPYLLFLAVSVIVAPASYLIARKLSGESRPLTPVEAGGDSDAE